MPNPIGGLVMSIFAYGSFTLDRMYAVSEYSKTSQASLVAWMHESAGGNAGNALRSAAAIGRTAHAVGTVGTDPAGNALVAGLTAAGVRTCFLRRLARARTKQVLAIVNVPSSSHQFYFIDGNDDSYGVPSAPNFAIGDVLIIDEATPAAHLLARHAQETSTAIVLNLGWCKHDPCTLLEIATVAIVS